MAKRGSNDENRQARVRFIDYDSSMKAPELAVYALDRERKVLKVSTVDKQGEFTPPDAGVLKKSHRIVIGPKYDDISAADRKLFATYTPVQFLAILEENGRFTIPKQKWLPWYGVRRCVSGSVTHCQPFPWLVADLVRRARVVPQALGTSNNVLATDTRVASLKLDAASDSIIAKPLPRPILPYRCDEVCDGAIEVYRRTCCCHPWIVFDPRLDDLLEELKRLVEVLPPDPWPPRPHPDPLPIQEIPFFKNGTLDDMALNVQQDLQVIRTLSNEELPVYINARPYLFCHCGKATKVARGFLRPDGEFTICWRDQLRLLPPNCHEEYSYVVKQVIDGNVMTIYDGLAANKWFHYGDFAKLVSYHPKAQSCRVNEFPGDGEGAFALLQDIGLTPSYRLKTPDATGWDRVATPVYNDGLAYPAVNLAAAKGKYLDRNWGGNLLLRYHFSESMKGLGAKYYRVSISAADSNGNPTGTRSYLAPKEWSYYEYVGATPHVRKTSLGPHSAGTQDNLYEIPYDVERAWHSGQYHASLNTTQFANGRFLLTVEVFDDAGQILRPAGTANPGGSTEVAFTYRRWYQETGPTAEVPFAALTHMLWWDNRKAEANIIDLRVNSVPNTAQCQFMVGPGGNQFSIGYRAYHHEPMFMLDHRIWWRRGLGGPSGILTSPNPNPDNVGVPPNPPHQSGADSFTDMLAGLSNPKCSFSVNLHVNVKTFNGIGTLNGLDDWDQAAFALEMIP